MTTEIGRVKCWVSTQRLGRKQVLDRETGMACIVKTTHQQQQQQPCCMVHKLLPGCTFVLCPHDETYGVLYTRLVRNLFCVIRFMDVVLCEDNK